MAVRSAVGRVFVGPRLKAAQDGVDVLRTGSGLHGGCLQNERKRIVAEAQKKDEDFLRQNPALVTRRGAFSRMGTPRYL
jgi:hypothetical protein